jgi:glutamine amidotransferase-like uncharacterized protein
MKEERVNHQNQLRGRRMGIYTGSGTSHSWLWFVDILEKAGVKNLTFLGEDDIKKDGNLQTLDVLLLSGGDTFSIAEGLGGEGSEKIERFVAEGGIYFGSCAGAYLPMKSSKYPLNLMNLAGVKISNLSRLLPRPLIQSEKFCTPYGCDYVFHPVRDEVKIRCTNVYFPEEQFVAPLYGGPCMEPSEDATPVAYYSGFTDKTLFLVDEDLARETVQGRIAVCSKTIGRGKLYLSGPHLEHPHYPTANRFLMEILSDGLKERKAFFHKRGESEARSEIPRDSFRKLKGELSGARIIALALERETMTWLIGKKVYEPEKFRVFIDALWSRINHLEKISWNGLSSETVHGLAASAREVREKLKELKSEMQTSTDTTGLVEAIIRELRTLSSAFMNVYFGVKRGENVQEEKSNVHVL